MATWFNDVKSARAVYRTDTTGLNQTLNVVHEPYSEKATHVAFLRTAFP